jgi:hypothetical protein
MTVFVQITRIAALGIPALLTIIMLTSQSTAVIAITKANITADNSTQMPLTNALPLSRYACQKDPQSEACHDFCSIVEPPPTCEGVRPWDVCCDAG